MKQILNFALILSFFLTACSSTTATPLIPTLTPIPLEPTLTETATVVPSETPTQTPVPLLEDLPLTKESINQFANALNATGVATTPELIIQQGLTVKAIIGVDGKKYEMTPLQ